MNRRKGLNIFAAFGRCIGKPRYTVISISHCDLHPIPCRRYLKSMAQFIPVAPLPVHNLFLPSGLDCSDLKFTKTCIFAIWTQCLKCHVIFEYSPNPILSTHFAWPFVLKADSFGTVETRMLKTSLVNCYLLKIGMFSPFSPTNLDIKILYEWYT